MNAYEVTVNDRATPAIEARLTRVQMTKVQRAVGTACSLLEKDHFRSLPPNKMGWPSTGFWTEAADSVEWEPTESGVSISADIPDKPGALRMRYYGGTISMKDKLLTIPASAEFYGRNAREFANLKFVQFGPGGAKALVIGTRGTMQSRNYGFGGEGDWHKGKGLGATSQGRVAFWLVESVEQEANPDVLPSPEVMMETARRMVLACWGGEAQ